MTALTIEDLRIRAVRVPLNPPHRTASGVITESPLILTDLITKEGVEGRSMIFTYTAAALKPALETIAALVPLVRGQRTTAEALFDNLSARFRLLGTHGFVGMAIAAIDMALWDAVARAMAVPLWKALGGSPKGFPAYAGVGFDRPSECARQAEAYAKQGLLGVKAKVGYTTVQEDREVVRAIRAAVGPDLAVMIDYNQALSVEEAIRRVKTLEEEALTWVEEPVYSHDFFGHAEVSREVETPIQAGENWWGPVDVDTGLQTKATDYVMFDAMKIGGVTGWLRAAGLAIKKRARVSSHLFPEISAQLLSATSTAHWLEYADWWNPVMSGSLRIERGMVKVGDVIGTGIEWDHQAIGTYLA